MGKKKSGISASKASIDPTLDALFSASSGPVKAPPKSRYSGAAPKPVPKQAPKSDDHEDEDEEMADGDEELSEASQELDDEDDDSSADEEEQEDASEEETKDASKPKAAGDAVAEEASDPPRERKRKRKEENVDLEDKYLSKLAQVDDAEPKEKRNKTDKAATSDDDEDDAPPQHESLAKDTKSTELEKADRTVFLANVSSDAVSSKSAKKTLATHLASVLDKDAGEKVESLRFRSVAFSAGSMPKRAAYITKQLMEATTKSTNAYAVFSSVAAANKAVKGLNGTQVLERHIRVDSVSHPTPTDHRRCVFVGNLGFMDDESVLEENKDGETIKKKRNKVPADVEEGLWRTFSTQGKVENVRVVRDPKTRVGKGFAYVQFYDGNAVESALLLNEKRFPPMLPRTLRVTRAKDPRKTTMALERSSQKLNGGKPAGKGYKYNPKYTPEEKSQAGRAGKLLGKAGAAMERRKGSGKERRPSGRPDADAAEGMKTPQQIVFEGARAKRERPLDGKRIKKNKKAQKGGRPEHRGARRAAEWKKTKE